MAACARKDRSVAAVEIMQELRRTADSSGRSHTIGAFVKNLRRRDAFHASWQAVGEAQGLANMMADFSVRNVANMMADFSVRNVRTMCHLLGRTAPALYLREERRAGLTELVQILTSGETDDRPFRSFYQAIVPAFVLTRIPSATGKQVYIASDFMQWFAMPLLRKLSKRRGRPARDEHNKFLVLVMECIKAHLQLFKSELRLVDRRGLIQFIMERADVVPEDRDLLTTQLAILLSLAATKGLWIQGIWDASGIVASDLTIYAIFSLERLHQGQSSALHENLADSVLHQVHSPGAREVDLDIFQTVLERKQDPWSRRWTECVLATLKEREKKASESREPLIRAFWATSTLRLPIAAGDLGILHETLLWARRVIKDPLVAKKFFGSLVVNCPELKLLMVSVPLRKELKGAERIDEALATAQRDIVPANNMLLSLLKIALSTVTEPSFKANEWMPIIGLAKQVAEGRVVSFLSQLHFSDPLILADLTTHYLDGMNCRLPLTLVKSYIGHIVTAVVRLCQGTQPSHAIPFILPIIQISENSSNHRQLLTTSFLESLPASTARHFMTTTASTILERMKEQKSRPWKERESPLVKVTAVKMIAEILERNRVIPLNLSYDILVSLLKEACHIDARLSIISGLLSMMTESTSTADLRKNILGVFEEHVLPVASQLNERRPTTEEDWVQLKIPEVGDQNGPLVLLRRKLESSQLKPKDRAGLVRILIAAFEQSAIQNERWINLFAERLP
ncbi:hypothetical protein PWT90_03722 [Aphanocladium album]|nr:hypothetical protein PWT90_03722 [Aphanocladium album]